MKKLILILLCSSAAIHAFAQQSPEKTAQELENVSQKYNLDMRHFLRSLPLSTTQFNEQQKQTYCGIVNNYVNNFYSVVDRNRASMPLSYASMTKRDIISKVEQSTEMQLLKKYNIRCNYDV